MIIETFRNYLRKKRLFLNDKEMNRFIQNNFNNKLEGYVRSVNTIKHYMNANDKAEVKERCKQLKRDGISPPENLRGCDNLIRDLRNWTL